MSENTSGPVGRDELMERIAAQIASNETVASVAEDSTLLSPETTVLVAEIENDLITAERFSRPRTSLGSTSVPGRNTPFAPLLLRLHALIFRDQRNADAALVAALRKSLRLNIRLAAEFALLRQAAESRALAEGRDSST